MYFSLFVSLSLLGNPPVTISASELGFGVNTFVVNATRSGSTVVSTVTTTSKLQ